MKIMPVLNAVLGIATEIIYASAIMLEGFCLCLVFSFIR